MGRINNSTKPVLEEAALYCEYVRPWLHISASFLDSTLAADKFSILHALYFSVIKFVRRRRMIQPQHFIKKDMPELQK